MSTVLSENCERSAANIPVSNLPSSTHLNVAYGSDPKQVLDVYLPAGRTTASTKVMFLIHGGGWSGGDKSSFGSYIDSLKNYLTDYAFVNINYRLANYTDNKFPTQENDIREAIRFVTKKFADYSVSDKVVLLGASAGAHLALLQAYKYTEPVKTQAVVSFFGPADMEFIYNNPVNPQVPFMLQILMGGSPEQKPEIYRQSSPINFVTNQSCPTLLLQGGKDPVVDPRQASILKQKLESAGVPNKLIVYPAEGHGWGGPSLGDSFRHIGAFLNRYVR